MTNSNETSPVPKSLHERQSDRVDAIMENEVLELTEWEETFCRSLQNQLLRWQHKDLSDKQMAIVEKLEGYILNGRPNNSR